MHAGDTDADLHKPGQWDPPLSEARGRSRSMPRQKRPGDASTSRGRTPGGTPMPDDTLPLRIRVRVEQRNARLRELGYESYRDYLWSDAWAEVKERYRQSPVFPQQCICGETNTELHHLTYERVGQERLEDLTLLCRGCHAMLHALERRGVVPLDFIAFYDPIQARKYRETRADSKTLSPDEWHEARLAHQVEAKKAKSRFRRGRRKVDPSSIRPLADHVADLLQERDGIS